MRILIALVALATASCQQPETRLTNDYLTGRWEYLGSWKNTVLQHDTLMVSFLGDNDTTLMDSMGYLVVTDSGTWRFTEVDHQTVAARRDPYHMTFDFENDSVGYFRDQDIEHSLIGAYRVNRSNGRLMVYAEPVIDESLAETIVPAQQGVIERISEDTLRIRWDHGTVNKFGRANRYGS